MAKKEEAVHLGGGRHEMGRELHNYIKMEMKWIKYPRGQIFAIG